MLPLLNIAAEGQKRVADVEERIADDFGLTRDERQELLPSGRQRILHNRIHWAKFYMTKAGLLGSPARGCFVATEAGKMLLAENPVRVDVKMLLQRPEFRKFYKGENDYHNNAGRGSHVVVSATELDTVATTPEEQIEIAFRSVQLALRAELLERVVQNSPTFFEQLIVDLLVAMGYGGSHKSAAAQLGRSGDGGVDGVVNEDPLGLDRVYVQAKRYVETNTVGRPDVQSFVGSLVGLGATKGVFVTTSTFSLQAHDFVKHLTQRVILIDGQRLGDLMIEHSVGVRVSRALEFKRLDEDFFAEE